MNKPVEMTEFLAFLIPFCVLGNISARSLGPDIRLSRSARENMGCMKQSPMCPIRDIYMPNVSTNQKISIFNLVNGAPMSSEDRVIRGEVMRIIIPEVFKSHGVRIIIGESCMDFPGSVSGCNNNRSVDFECEWQTGLCSPRLKTPHPGSPDVNDRSVGREVVTPGKRDCWRQSPLCVIRDLYMLNSSGSQDILIFEEETEVNCYNGTIRCEPAEEDTRIIIPPGFQRDIMIIIDKICMDFPASNRADCNATVDFECNVKTGQCSPRTDLIITPTTESITTSHHNDPASDRITTERAANTALKIAVPVVAIPLSLVTVAAFFYKKTKNP